MGAIIPYEREEKMGLREFVKDFEGESIGVFIGPEGGFAEEEIALAKENGYANHPWETHPADGNGRHDNNSYPFI